MSIMEFMRAVEDLALTYGIEVPDVFDFSAEAIALVYGGKPVIDMDSLRDALIDLAFRNGITDQVDAAQLADDVITLIFGGDDDAISSPE